MNLSFTFFVFKDDEEYHRAKLLDDHSSSDSEEATFHSTLGLDNTVLTQSDHEHDEERARQALLEESDDSDHDDHQQQDNDVFRPSIRLKRISQEDARLYMPLAWRNGKDSLQNCMVIENKLFFRRFSKETIGYIRKYSSW